MKIFVVVPLFNEETHVAGVLKGLSKYKLPVIVVDDGSTDDSVAKIKELKLKNITVLQHEINLGKGAAMKTGAEYAFENGADAIIFIDSDRQHETKDICKFIKELESRRFDVIFGSRNFSYGVPVVRYFGNKAASIIISFLFGIYVSDVICGFRAITRNAYEKIKWESTGYGVETEMVVRVGKRKLKYYEVPVETIYHDKVKGVTILDALGIFGSVLKWKLTK